MIGYIMPFIVILMVITMVYIMNKAFDYQCGYCNAIFSLSLPVAIFSPHMMGKKLVVCPHCGQRTWATLVPRGK